MKTADIIVAYPGSSDNLNALKAFMKSLNIKFEVTPSNESPYNKDFVDKILDGEKAIKEGRGTRITIEEIDDLWK